MSEARFRRLLPAGGDASARELVAELALAAATDGERPAVALNMIASLDGRVTMDGRTAGLATRADYEMFHALRTAGDAVLVGAGTVRAESYGALDRLAVVVSHSLDLPADLGLLRAPGNRVLVVTDAEGTLDPCAAEVRYLRLPDMNLAEALRRIRSEYDVGAVVCEGGPHLNAELLAAGLVDELHLVLSPKLVGGENPLTLVAGSAAAATVDAELVWVLESDGYLFTRYRLPASPA